MRVEENCTYCVAPLNKSEKLSLIKHLRGIYPEPSGIPTFIICREIGKFYPNRNNLCWTREDRYKPCTTLCYIIVDVLHMLHERTKVWDNKHSDRKNIDYSNFTTAELDKML